MRMVTKASYPHDSYGLRSSAILYFISGVIFVAFCLISYNITTKLPIIQYYKDLKTEAIKEERFNSSLWDVVNAVKWLGLGKILLESVTLSIFPGFLTEDVHSQILMDWYPILLITCFDASNFLGTSLPAVYLLKNVKIVIGGSTGRLIFYPLFLGCLHGPTFFRKEIPVVILTCLLGLTNGYFISVLMILAPKLVKLQHSENAALVGVFFSYIGLVLGSIIAWFWLI